MSSFPLSGEAEAPSERRASGIREYEQTPLAADGQRRLERRVLTLLAQLRLSACPPPTNSIRSIARGPRG
jgi:hypothetical protein